MADKTLWWHWVATENGSMPTKPTRKSKTRLQEAMNYCRKGWPDRRWYWWRCRRENNVLIVQKTCGTTYVDATKTESIYAINKLRDVWFMCYV